MGDSRERFLIVAFAWSGPPKVKELEPLFNTALDWMRVANNVWILWTNSDPTIWATHIKKHLVNEESVFIGELDLTTALDNYSGWEKKWVWDWIDQHRFPVQTIPS